MDDDVQHERELREQWQTAHGEVHVLEQKALDIAKAGINARLEEMNNLRAQVESERGRYLSREVYDEQHAALRDGIDARLKLLETAKSNLEGRIWMMGAGISGAVVVLNLILRYFGSK